MPELPEVETVRRSLELHILNRTVTSVGGKDVALRRPLRPQELGEAMIGARLEAFRRRGKFLLADLDRGGSLLVHLGMTGRLHIAQSNEPRAAHTHLVLGLDDGRELRYVDSRRFGLVDWLAPKTEAEDPSLRTLGLEPLHPQIVDLLPPILHARRAPVKALLMDQRLVAGVGNIYAAEALFRAHVRPTRAGTRTSLARLADLARAVREVLSEAVEKGGTTLRDYATPEGEFGYFAVQLKVYGRQGEPCTACGTILRSATIAGRTTSWCPRCQH